MITNKIFDLKKPTFVLKNKKGQVAIFVALIFQVVFVFFALLINVGLLVHHKINLQQSTDLAAYYGAMKQAESLNMISHVNFQMRQAWKLLAWRYRVLGTFGFQTNDSSDLLKFPITISGGGGVNNLFTGVAAEQKCGSGINMIDAPFFCLGHIGFKEWPANENSCKAACVHLDGVGSSIQKISLSGGTDSNFTGTVIRDTEKLLDQANKSITKSCENLGPFSFNTLAKFIMSYATEVNQKKKLIQMLGSNLSAPVEKAVDLEGGLIKEGVNKTFENNLTEANLTGKISFSAINGLADSTCAFKGNENDGKEGQNQFITQIKFQAIQYFIHQCSGASPSSWQFKPLPMFDPSNYPKITNDFLKTLSSSDQSRVQNTLANIEYILGYEKNPWCQVYYGVKAQTEPKIPFLPLSKIKLSAVSFAKPFGGTLGPRYKAVWPSGQGSSDSGQLLDTNLPSKNVAGLPAGATALQQSISILPNYANFPGDAKGLKDVNVLGIYHDLLLHRQIQGNISELDISVLKEGDSAKAPNAIGYHKPNSWPDYSYWNNLSDPTSADYDYLALQTDPSIGNSFLRDIELSVVAPNLFDLTYYSIDPDYYNNYYLKLKGGNAGNITFTESLSKIKNAAGGYGPDAAELKPDYGSNAKLESDRKIAKNFSVRHQIAVVSKIIKKTPTAADFPGSLTADNVLSFIPYNPSSLLTGWTFKSFTNYTDFPNEGPDNKNTMTFGKCADPEWNQTDDSSIANLYDSPANKNFPPLPGNCITGGRTGYSVKLVSPGMVRASNIQAFGGDGTNGPIVNFLNENFLNF